MPCHCTCGRIIDCDRIKCDICEDVADTTSPGLPPGMKEEDYDL